MCRHLYGTSVLWKTAKDLVVQDGRRSSLAPLWASPESLLEMQSLMPCPRPAEPRSAFNKTPRWFIYMFKLEQLCSKFSLSALQVMYAQITLRWSQRNLRTGTARWVCRRRRPRWEAVTALPPLGRKRLCLHLAFVQVPVTSITSFNNILQRLGQDLRVKCK